MDSLEAELLEIKTRGLLRKPSISTGVDFASNDYLGYSCNSDIHEQLQYFFKLNPQIGATGSRLISGHSSHIEKTEEFLAQSFATEASLIFGSGYLANLGICVALGSIDTEFFSDEFNHASLIDGIRLSKSKVSVYPHLNLEHLNSHLLKSIAKRKVIVTESIFSMDGDAAPLEHLIKLAEQHDGYLIVDEAHSTGTYGAHGLGMMKQIQVYPSKTIVVHTCGKALGGYGAFICGTKSLKELLLNKARSQIFTTALPPILVEQIRISVAQLIADKNSLRQLKENVELSKELFCKYDLKHSGSHIIPFILGSNTAVLNAAAQMQKEGINVKAIRSPTVPLGTERIRLTIKSTHKSKDIERMCKTLADLKDEYFCNRN